MLVEVPEALAGDDPFANAAMTPEPSVETVPASVV
jgi:hypothetical protein